MIRVVTDVDFAAIRNFAVAISKPLFAVPNGAHRVLATSKCIRGFAFGSARATILPAFSEIDFASVEQRVVAIGKTSTTRHAARSSITRRAAIDAKRARFVTTTAIVDIGGRVRTRLETTGLARRTRPSRPARFGIDNGVGASIGDILGTVLVAKTIGRVFTRRRTSNDDRHAGKREKRTKIVFHHEPRRRRAVTAKPNANVASAPKGASSFFSPTTEHLQPPPPVGSPHVPG